MSVSDQADALPEGRQLVRTAVADFLRYVARVLDLTDLTQGGARVLVSIRDQLQELDPESGSKDRSIRERAALAESELDRDFPLLNAHALMGLWGALEACIDDVCVGWLIESRGEGAREAMQRVRVSLSDVYFLVEPERSQRLLDWIKANLGSERKQGAGQFESALAAIGIGGSIDEHVRQLLFYAKEMRNVVAHRGGRIDQRLLALGPEIVRAEIGETLSIRTAQVFAIASAMLVYAESLWRRIEHPASETLTDFPPWVESTEQLLSNFRSSPATGRGASAV